MINKEKYKEKIFEIACQGSICACVKLNNGILKLQPCRNTYCKACIFYSEKVRCEEVFIKWLEEEATETDWSKVGMDTKILVSNDGKTWICAHFANYNKSEQLIGAWVFGKTSFTVSDKHNIEYYSYAKLYKGDENNG